MIAFSKGKAGTGFYDIVDSRDIFETCKINKYSLTVTAHLDSGGTGACISLWPATKENKSYIILLELMNNSKSKKE